MSNFVKGTIAVFTEHALKKMDEVIAEKTDVNLSKIIISDREYDLSEGISLKNIRYSYALPVVRTENDAGNQIVTFIAEIPEEVVKLNIKTIGLVDVEEDGTEELFAISKINLYKPSRSECHYNLIIELNFALKIARFEMENLGFYIDVPEYATGDDLKNFKPAINTDIIALEHAIMENAVLIGANRPQVIYRADQEYFSYFSNYARILEFLTACEIGQGTLTDAFFNDTRSFYFAYSTLNLAKYDSIIKRVEDIQYDEDLNSYYRFMTRNAIDFTSPNCSYMRTNNEVMMSNYDTVNLVNNNSSATTMVISAIINNETETVNSKGNVRWKNCEILYKCEETDENSRIFSIKREQNQLTGYATWDGGFISFKTKMNKGRMGILCDGELHNIIMIFDRDGITDSDKFKLYIDKTLIPTEIVCSISDEYDLAYAPFYNGIYNLSFRYDKDDIENSSKYSLWLDRTPKEITVTSDTSNIYITFTEKKYIRTHTVKLEINKSTKQMKLYEDNVELTNVEFEYKHVKNELYKSHNEILTGSDEYKFSLRNYGYEDGVATSYGNHIDKILCFTKALTFEEINTLTSSLV